MKTLKIFVFLPLAVFVLFMVFMYIFHTFGYQILDMLNYIFDDIFKFINKFMAFSHSLQR